MNKKEEYMYWVKKYWYSMFKYDGYIGEGVYVSDILKDYVDQYDEMTESEVDQSIKEYKQILSK